jgi:integral membrane protein (TIGR00529 family)
MTNLFPLLPLFKLVAVFGLVILLLRVSSQVGFALGIGAAALGLVFFMSPMEIANAFGLALLDARSLIVALIVTLILILSASMEQLGQTEELLQRFKGWVGGRRWGLVAFPALIGLLPMPGGAIFSAPMLDSFDQGNHIVPSLKSFLNYWYRHIWESWWPLYPGILLACAIANLDLWHYIVLAFPMTVVAIAGGLPQLIQVPRLIQGHSAENDGTKRPIPWRNLCPLLLAILPGVAFGIFLRYTETDGVWVSVPKEAGLVVGLIAAVGWAWWDRRVRLDQARKILLDRKLLRMWVTLAGVFVFKTVMQESDAASDIGEALINLEIPLEVMIVLLPMILGTISGLPLAFVGAAFPIVVPLIQTMGAADVKIPLIILAYVSGFTGVILSPLHLCLILSNEYFRASWSSVYRRLWLPALTILGGGIGYFWVLRFLGE